MAELRRQAHELGIADRLIWAGSRSDMVGAYNAMDIATLASFGEGFPNVVGEAMACGVPCVVTDVGDSRSIVADTGLCVPPNDVNAMRVAWEALLRRAPEDMAALRLAARGRVVEHYSAAALLARTLPLLSRPDVTRESPRCS